MRNQITFRLTGRYALFTDPITKLGGEKTSYPIPTYEVLKGVCKSIYWKPTFIWYVDRVKVINPIQTYAKGVRPIKYDAAGNDLAYYTYLCDVDYLVQAHFEWNPFRPELSGDRSEGKHFSIATRMLERGGRQDIFLGARECQGYVEPVTPEEFETAKSSYDKYPQLTYGFMFHSFGYPDEIGQEHLESRFWNPVMRHGVVDFPKPSPEAAINEQSGLKTRVIRPMKAKTFQTDKNFQPVKSMECES